VLVAPVVEDVAGREHVGVGKPDVSIAVCMRVEGMRELRAAALHVESDAAAIVGAAGETFGWQRRILRTVQVADAPRCEPLLHVLMRDDNDAVLAEKDVAAGMV